MTELSPTELAVLRFLEGCGNRGARAGVIGYAVVGENKRGMKRTPQGMALFAGKFLNHLYKKRLIGGSRHGWVITDTGRQHLRTKQPASEAQP